jgi:hypothetical protein
MAQTVRVFQRAIEDLADDPHDRIGETLDQIAEQIAEVALENARRIIPSLPAGFLVVESGKDTKGLFFRVRPDREGHWSRYLSAKEIREHAWFEPAVAEVMGAENLRTPLSF